MEGVLYMTPVENGDYIYDCGFKCDMTGSAYFRSQDDNAFHEWFRTHMHPSGWTLTCGGPANPHNPEFNSKGERLDKVYSMKRHFHGRGKQGTLGRYQKSFIPLQPESEGVNASA